LILSVREHPRDSKIPLALDNERAHLDVDSLPILGRRLKTDVLLAKVEATVQKDVFDV
jgi:hypothetical protein